MGVRLIFGHEEGDRASNHKVVMFDSVTGIAFGPVFDSLEEAEHVVDSLHAQHKDPREVSIEEFNAMIVAYDAAHGD